MKNSQSGRRTGRHLHSICGRKAGPGETKMVRPVHSLPPVFQSSAKKCKRGPTVLVHHPELANGRKVDINLRSGLGGRKGHDTTRAEYRRTRRSGPVFGTSDARTFSFHMRA